MRRHPDDSACRISDHALPTLAFEFLPKGPDAGASNARQFESASSAGISNPHANNVAVAAATSYRRRTEALRDPGMLAVLDFAGQNFTEDCLC